MGAPKNTIVVSRRYESDRDSCTRALKLLLKEKAAGTSGGEDARREDLDAPGRFIIPKPQ